MTKRPATGLQLAFLMFALTLLSVPLGSYILTGQIRSDAADRLALRIFPFAIFAALVATIRPLRSQAISLLRIPIGRHHRLEVVMVALAMIPLAWATTGARMIWTLATGDLSSLASMRVDAETEWANATSSRGLVLLALSVLVAPALEELVCRGFMYRAFARDWGWIPACVVTSAIFASYHPFFLNAFAFALVMVCVMRRTGSLRAPILVHAFSNLIIWWPLLGQYIFPNPSLPAEAIETWIVNIVSLGLAMVLLPTYLWMSRDRPVVIAPTQFLEPNVPLQK
jgi:membrane protease YdiL (CAAX protease family)